MGAASGVDIHAGQPRRGRAVAGGGHHGLGPVAGDIRPILQADPVHSGQVRHGVERDASEVQLAVAVPGDGGGRLPEAGGLGVGADLEAKLAHAPQLPPKICNDFFKTVCADEKVKHIEDVSLFLIHAVQKFEIQVKSMLV